MRLLVVNLRLGGGGGHFDWPHHLFFFANSGKTAAPYVLHSFLYINIALFQKNFSPRLSQLMSPGQVKWSYISNIYDCVVTTVFKVLISNFQKLIRSISTYKTFISEFSEAQYVCTYFDASWREKHDAGNIMLLAFLAKKLFEKAFFVKQKRYFDRPWHL